MFARFVLTLLLSIGVAHAEQPLRADNVFFINGRNIEAGPELLKELRSFWSDSGGPFKTSLSLADVQWVHDYISITQGIRKPPCKRLKLLNIERRENKEDIVQGRVIRSGLFDEQWTIDACGENYVYRVFNQEGSSELAVYAMRK